MGFSNLHSRLSSTWNIEACTELLPESENERLCFLDAISAHDLVSEGKVSLIDVAKQVAKRRTALNTMEPSFSIFVQTAEDLEQQARERDSSKGDLVGCTFVSKDLIQHVSQYKHTRGLSKRATNTPETSSHALVERCLAKGALFVGTTNTSPSGAYGTSASYKGITRNAFSRKLVAGGSSGGSAVAVATGLASFGLANDGAGSIRIPAGFNGVVGLRPDTDLPGFGADWVAQGPITRSVADAAFIMDHLSTVPGHYLRDLDALAIEDVDLVVPVWSVPPLVEPAVEKRYREQLDSLSKLGVPVREVSGAPSLPMDAIGARWLNMLSVPAEIPLIKALLELGAVDYPHYTKMYDDWIAAWDVWCGQATQGVKGRVSCIVTPVTAVEPWAAVMVPQSQAPSADITDWKMRPHLPFASNLLELARAALSTGDVPLVSPPGWDIFKWNPWAPIANVTRAGSLCLPAGFSSPKRSFGLMFTMLKSSDTSQVPAIAVDATLRLLQLGHKLEPYLGPQRRPLFPQLKYDDPGMPQTAEEDDDQLRGCCSSR